MLQIILKLIKDMGYMSIKYYRTDLNNIWSTTKWTVKRTVQHNKDLLRIIHLETPSQGIVVEVNFLRLAWIIRRKSFHEGNAIKGVLYRMIKREIILKQRVVKDDNMFEEACKCQLLETLGLSFYIKAAVNH